MQKDFEKARFESPTDAPYEENAGVGIATWKIFLAVTIVLGIISIPLILLNYPRLAGSIFGCGMLILIVYCAFRNVPTVRRRTGDGGNIDFGTR